MFDTDTDTHAAIYECSQRLAGALKGQHRAPDGDAVASLGASGASEAAAPPPPASADDGLDSESKRERDRLLQRHASRRHWKLPRRRGERGKAAGAGGDGLAPGPPPPPRLTVVWSVDMDERARGAPGHEAVGGGGSPELLGGRISLEAAADGPPGSPRGSKALAHALAQFALILCLLCCCWAVVTRLLRCARRRRELHAPRHEGLHRCSESEQELEEGDSQDRRVAGGAFFRRGQVRTPSPAWGPAVGWTGGARPAAAGAAEHEAGYGGDCES